MCCAALLTSSATGRCPFGAGKAVKAAAAPKRVSEVALKGIPSKRSLTRWVGVAREGRGEGVLERLSKLQPRSSE